MRIFWFYIVLKGRKTITDTLNLANKIQTKQNFQTSIGMLESADFALCGTSLAKFFL